MQMVQHGAGGAAAGAVGRVAVESVLADVEIKGAEVIVAEAVQVGDHAGPVVIGDRFADAGVEFREAVEHPALQFGQFGERQGLGFGKTFQRAQQPAQRVADAAIDFGLLFQDFLADAQILRGVRIHHPKAEDIGAVIAQHLLWRSHIADGFGHFAALLIEHKAMGQNGLEGGDAAAADALQQRGMEPAAMLVRAFEVEIGREGHVAGAEDEGVG